MNKFKKSPILWIIIALVIIVLIPPFGMVILAYTDMRGEAQKTTRYALCHYEDPVWIQQYIDTTTIEIHSSCGSGKESWCELKNGSYSTKCSKIEDIQEKINDKPGSYWAPCPGTGEEYVCKYNSGTHTSTLATSTGVNQLLIDFPTSHRYICNGHETHTDDYIGLCIGIAQ